VRVNFFFTTSEGDAIDEMTFDVPCLPQAGEFVFAFPDSMPDNTPEVPPHMNGSRWEVVWVQHYLDNNRSMSSVVYVKHSPAPIAS
jgi:hypothetical protein